ncbi:MAG: mannose-1-phosphate guanylyltransferase [Candidatus Marinimicrobia bacterium]|nr:mannose-1-phosphate guanylyltransferase [Candidatus Neomarinimicrobiota bacterium]
MYHVILAGGSGSRFWPKSRKDTPKQLLKILGEETMIRLTYNRLREISEAHKIFIVASDKLSKLIHNDIPEIPQENFIIEPSGKNTAPAIGLAALHIFKRDSDAIMGVYPADHLIVGDSKFRRIIENAQKMVEQKSCLITIGIKPTYPATGYGYIQYDSKKEMDIKGVYKVKTFAEKPEKETAEKFIVSGEFLWNAGMFIWKAEIILLEMKTFMCELHDSLDSIYDALGSTQYETVLDREWELVQPESIDYGILEKAKNVYTIKADFQWNDLGSWYSLFSVLTKNNDTNYHDGDVISVQSENNLIISPDRLTAVVGVNDMAIINLDDATLIVPHDKSEAVKDVVKMLKSMNKSEYL